jgi:acyl-ACP thioesterase
LGVSVFVLIEVRKIKNAFKLRVRGPVIIKELVRYSSNLSGYLDEFEDSLPQIADELGKARAKLKYLKKTLSSDTKTSVKRLLKSIEKCEIKVDNKDGVRLVYVEMNQVLEEVKDHQKDIRLGV